MRKNGLKNRSLMKTTFSYHPPPHIKEKSSTSGGNILIRWGFTFFVGLWMFFLGVVIGRQTAPINFHVNPIENQLALLKKAEQKENQKKIQTDINALNEKNLDFYDDLRQGSHNIKKTIQLSEPKDIPEVKKPLVKKNIENIKNKEIIQPDFSASSESVKNLKPNMHMPNPSGSFGIQVASFAVLEDAQQMVSNLVKKGYKGAYQVSEEVYGVGIRYRVKVGYFQTKAQAIEILNQLRNNEKFTDAYIFKKK